MLVFIVVPLFCLPRIAPRSEYPNAANYDTRQNNMPTIRQRGLPAYREPP
jgi:hypothetical protein